MELQRLSHYLSRTILVKMAGDAPEDPMTFRLVGIEPCGLWLEPVDHPYRKTTRTASVDFLPGTALVPYAQIAYVLCDLNAWKPAEEPLLAAAPAQPDASEHTDSHSNPDSVRSKVSRAKHPAK